MKLQKTLLILSASAMLSAAVIAPDVALAQPFPGPPPGGPPPGPVGGLLPAYPAAVLLVSLVRAVLRVLGPPLAFLDLPASAGPLVSLVPADLLVPVSLAFLVLTAPVAVAQAPLAATAALTAAPGPMCTATPPTMATAARATAIAMGRGDTATGLKAPMSTAIVLTPAAVITPTSTAPACAHTGAFGLAPNSHCGG